MPESTHPAGFAEFYDTYLPKVYGYVRQRVDNTPMAEDLTAMVFEKALAGWNGRRKPSSLVAWLFRIARNTVISHYRRKGNRRETVLEEPDGEPAIGPGPEDCLIKTERWDLVRDAVRQLSRREQDIIALRFGGGLTNRAISPIVGISEGNVAVILHRSLRKLQATLERNQATLAQEETQ